MMVADGCCLWRDQKDEADMEVDCCYEIDDDGVCVGGLAGRKDWLGRGRWDFLAFPGG